MVRLATVRGVAALPGVVALTLASLGCSGGGSGPAQASPPAPSTTATAGSTTLAAATTLAGSITTPAGVTTPGTTTASGPRPNADPTRFDPASFAPDWESTNPFLPLVAGYQSVREGGVTKGSRRLPHRRVYTVTDVSKEIDGVRAVIVLDQDFDGGEVAEQSLNYYAEDTDGNVWYLGSYTETYEGGRFVNAEDGWLAGVAGAKAGVMMLTDPQPGQPAYVQAVVPGEGTSKARIVRSGASECVPFNCYSGVLVVEEGGSENKYYAPGVGGIRTQPKSGNPQETENLINLTQLTGDGLAELSAEALKLDENARTEWPDVFGDSAVAVRAS